MNLYLSLILRFYSLSILVNFRNIILSVFLKFNLVNFGNLIFCFYVLIYIFVKKRYYMKEVKEMRVINYGVS